MGQLPTHEWSHTSYTLAVEFRKYWVHVHSIEISAIFCSWSSPTMDLYRVLMVHIWTITPLDGACSRPHSWLLFPVKALGLNIGRCCLHMLAGLHWPWCEKYFIRYTLACPFTYLQSKWQVLPTHSFIQCAVFWLLRPGACASSIYQTSTLTRCLSNISSLFLMSLLLHKYCVCIIQGTEAKKSL